MRPPLPCSDRFARLLSGMSGAVFLIAALEAAAEARLHMQLTGALCGLAESQPHCAWCLGAAALAMAAGLAFAYALRPSATVGAPA